MSMVLAIGFPMTIWPFCCMFCSIDMFTIDALNLSLILPVDSVDLQSNLLHQLLQFSLESLFLRRFAGASTERHALGDGQAGDVHALRHPVLWGSGLDSASTASCSTRAFLASSTPRNPTDAPLAPSGPGP